MVQSSRLRFGHFLFDPGENLLLRYGERVALSPKVSETLALLLQHRGRIVSKAEFMEALWPETFVEESNLTQNIFILRKTLGFTDDGKPFVETVPKRGYRISTPVEEELPQPWEPEGAPHLATAPSPAALVPGMELTPEPGWEPINPPLPAPDADPPPEPAPGLAAGTALLPARSPSRWALGGWQVLTVAALLLLCASLYWLATPATTHPVVIDSTRITDDGVPKSLGNYPSPLVSDGRSLYFTEKADNQSELARVALAGGPVTAQPAPFPDATVVDYSPARGELLIGSTWHTADNRPILAAGTNPATGNHSPKPLGELTGHDASWSPRADRIAFAQGRFLQAADPGGANVRTLFAAPGVVYWPRWSHDGRSLRFTVNFGANASELWEVGADGSAPHQIFRLLPDSDQLCCGTWSADGRLFFYLSGGPATNAIWVMASSGSHPLWDRTLGRLLGYGLQPAPRPAKLSAGEADMWRSPLPSANGHFLYAIGSHSRGELMRLDPKTREFKPFLGGLSAEGVSYSPDGRWIAYTAYPKGTLWLARADGSDRRELTSPPAVARFPRWSPDGRTIAFMAGEAGSHWRLYLLSVATGQVSPLLEDEGNQGVASWSPDGSRIAFGRLLDYGTAGNPNLTVQIYDLATHSRTTLHGSGGLWTPRWSPDGRYFAAVTEDNCTLKLFDTTTGQWSDLANLGVNDVIWTPDGKYLFFDTAFGADASLYRVRIGDRHLERWADLHGLHRGGYFNPWLGLTPDGSPLVLRDTTVEEIYRLTLEASR